MMDVRIPLDPSFQQLYLEVFRWQLHMILTGLFWYLLGQMVEEVRRLRK